MGVSDMCWCGVICRRGSCGWPGWREGASDHNSFEVHLMHLNILFDLQYLRNRLINGDVSQSKLSHHKTHRQKLLKYYLCGLEMK